MKTCPYCGRELQGVVVTFPKAKPCCGRGDCLLSAMSEDAKARESSSDRG